MTSAVVRSARAEDLPALIGLCREHAEYEGARYEENGQAARLGRALFGAPPVLFGWVVESADGLAGYMTATRDYATWAADFFIHMDCLYLRAAYRGKGIGRQLIHALIGFARDRQCCEIQWQTPPDNHIGIAFYERIGARSKVKRRYVMNWSPSRNGELVPSAAR